MMLQRLIFILKEIFQQLKNNSMFLKIISQTNKVFEGEVKSVTVPSSTGEIQILPNHTNLISKLDIGVLKADCIDKEEFVVAVNEGLIQVHKDTILVLVNEASIPKDILKENLEEAIAMAEKKMSAKLSATEMIILEKQIRYQRFKKKLAEEDL